MSKNTMKKQTSGLVPRLRFPEFQEAGEWEERRLEQISNAIFDGTHQTPTYTEEGVPFFSVENIVSGKDNKFISREDYLLATSRNKPEKGDILITRIGKIGFSTVVDWEYDFSVYVTLAVIKQSEAFDSHFLNGFLQSERYQDEILAKSLLTAVPCKINMDELRKTRVLLPSFPEQQKIAACLSSLDALISAQADKLDALKTHKKGLMQQLFPREGETVPRLRFPEFREAGEWEQKPLGECLNYLQPTKYLVSSTDYDDKYQTPVLTAGKTFILGYTNETEGVFDKDLPVIIFDDFTTASKFVDFPFKAKSSAMKILLAKKGTSIKFVFESMQMLKYEVGVHERHWISIFSKLNVPVPTQFEEQQKIADCLSSLDALISAQADKLDALKTHKKGLMQQLFPVASAPAEKPTP